MIKQLHILTFYAVAVIFFSVCNYTVRPAEADETGPNTFDANGDLCLIGGNTPQEIGTPMELWAGAPNESSGILAGLVTFDNENVRINLTDVDQDGIPDMYPWVPTAVHIHFADTVDGIPHTKKWNPIVGQFEYNLEPDEFSYFETVDPFQSEIIVPVYFEAVGAIHLSVEKDYSGVDLFGDYLPEGEVLMSVAFPHPGDPSYLELTLSEAGLLNGVYESWCVDVDTTSVPDTQFTAQLYSSYEDLTGLGFEHPENFDKVNYLLNNFWAGKMITPLSSTCTILSNCGGDLPPEELTYGDIQRAIWILIDDNLTTAGLGSWNQNRVNALLCDVNANGEDYIPGCEEETVFIVAPDDGTVQLISAQTVISSIGVPCETAEETAWGDGKFGSVFPGSKQWGKYFLYDADCGL